METSFSKHFTGSWLRNLAGVNKNKSVREKVEELADIIENFIDQAALAVGKGRHSDAHKRIGDALELFLNAITLVETEPLINTSELLARIRESKRNLEQIDKLIERGEQEDLIVAADLIRINRELMEDALMMIRSIVCYLK